MARGLGRGAGGKRLKTVKAPRFVGQNHAAAYGIRQHASGRRLSRWHAEAGFVPRRIVAFSGGKDSTAMALRLHELGEDFELMFTPTGNELPAVFEHIDRVVSIVKQPIVVPPNPSLKHLIDTFNRIPNWRQRWCTRMIKIEPCIAYLVAHPGSELMVGLRADEEERQGLYGPYATYRYPLREWGWGLAQVLAYCEKWGEQVRVPVRTDCALCYDQRLSEWWALWKKHPDLFQEGVDYETRIGHTFRSNGRDTWPAKLEELRAEFEGGRVPRGAVEEDEDDLSRCRVCRL